MSQSAKTVYFSISETYSRAVQKNQQIERYLLRSISQSADFSVQYNLKLTLGLFICIQERIEMPSQFSLHRRVHIHSPSVDNDSLRNGAKETTQSEEKKKIRKVPPKHKKFNRHKSCNLLRTTQPGKDDALQF